MTDTRRRYTVKNSAIISNRKVEKKNNVIKQQKYVPVCMCVCVCDWGELKNDRVKKSKFTMGGGSELSHRKRERRKRCRRPWERERARQWKSARFCSDVDVFVGNSGLYAYAIIMKERSIVQFVFVFLSAAADLIWIRFKSSQALYCCCCLILFLSPKSFSTTKFDEPQTLFGPGEWRNLIKF